MKLVIGNKNYSSWSLRPWLLLHAFGVPFDEHLESLAGDDLSERLRQHSDSARVPVLVDRDLSVWDSLAICEYLNAQYLSDSAWPQDAKQRAVARAVVAEMHAGFAALRQHLPMNCRAQREIEISPAVRRDIQRIDTIWSQYARPDTEGNLRLFGSFGIADCFFAPVIMRFTTYDVAISQASQAYLNSMLAHPSLQKWVTDARHETEILSEEEVGVDRA
ncbi:glutathione S-transferase [Arenicella chitinivorans]|uniref:Glutathione S-transferase n=1 Tax=Arenicella chitinivorans TaxID=1329800 RepID=A0A918RN79_9GAMM|nr:glutathione S-transferase family protein [Arenicella chitinivorans]GHA05703.1 glutathione S-transferase [Arenicella chitinivorans]